jgi:hypothetical protein
MYEKINHTIFRAFSISGAGIGTESRYNIPPRVCRQAHAHAAGGKAKCHAGHTINR